MLELFIFTFALALGIGIGHIATKALLDYRLKDMTRQFDWTMRAYHREQEKVHDLRAELAKTKGGDA